MKGSERGIYFLGFVFGLLTSVFLVMAVVGLRFHILSLTMIGIPGVLCALGLFIFCMSYIESYREVHSMFSKKNV